MKKALIGIVLVLLLLIGGGLYYVFANLDMLVERGIETAGTNAAGTPVRVDSVELDLMGGSAIIRGFTLDNPPGYSNGAMLSFDELAVVIDTARMTRENLSIVSVTGRNPHLRYESVDGVSNLDTIRERMGPADAAPPPEGPGPALNIEVGSVVIESIGATVDSELMPNPVDVNLGDIRLQNLSGTPNEIAQEILQPLLTQLAVNAGRVALTLLPEDVRAAGAAVRDAAAAAAGQAGETVGAAIGNLLRRDGEETEEEDEPAGN